MLIGICGLAGSGKDTSGDFLVRDFDFVKVAFADPLKRIALDVYEFTDEQLWGPSEKRNEPDKRYPRKHSIYEAGASCACCGCSYDEADKTQCFLTPRFALQMLGTEWGRDCYDATWVEYALRVARRIQGGGHVYHFRRGLSSVSFVGDDTEGAYDRLKKSVVITDVRFINEVLGLREQGARLLRVLRPTSGLKGKAGSHRSETEQAAISDELFDKVIMNDNSLDALKAHVHEFMRSVT